MALIQWWSGFSIFYDMHKRLPADVASAILQMVCKTVINRLEYGAYYGATIVISIDMYRVLCIEVDLFLGLVRVVL